jgi:hypothetical protein
MTPILFLDVDHVLNTRPGSLDGDKLNILSGIVSACRCEIVLSSSWRKMPRQRDRLEAELARRGMQIYDDTPVLETEWRGLIHAQPRWREIEAWWERCRDLAGEAWVILDDEPDFGPYADHHVRTESDVGLTEQIAEEVIRRLGNAVE